MKKNLILVIILIIIALIAICFYFVYQSNKPIVEVNNFDECVKAGYPVSVANNGIRVCKARSKMTSSGFEYFTEITNFDQCVKATGEVSGNRPRLCKIPDMKSSTGYDLFVEDIGNASVKQDLIKVTNLAYNSEVTSPLTIKGEARGYWFFEASFPVQIYDSNNNLLGSVSAQAQSDWMTQDFVPFTATLEFNDPTTETGALILKKDNPSGLPQNDDQLIIPVIFIFKKSATTAVKAYFSNNNLDPQISCNKVFPVDRIIPKTQAVARAALEELLKGPTENEKSNGYFTSINPGVKIQSLTIENGTAKVDFDEQLEFQVGGSCRVSAIRAQITQTLMQFSTVKNVIISIDGRTEDILQP